MRKLSAHYIFTGTGEILNKGIITITDQGVISDILDTHGDLDEMAGVEFFSGIITPGFTCVHCPDYKSDCEKYFPNTSEQTVIKKITDSFESLGPETVLVNAKKDDVDLWRNGLIAVGEVSNNITIFPLNLNLENHTVNAEFLQSKNLLVCVGIESFSSNPKLQVLEELKKIQTHWPGITLGDMISWATRNGAEALTLNGWCGTIELGKKPGINLITGLDLHHLRLKPESKIKRLI